MITQTKLFTLGSAPENVQPRHEGERETALMMGSYWSDLNAGTTTTTMTGHMATLNQSMELHKFTERTGSQMTLSPNRD
ncbi:hypothetical protein DPMN_028172 [Dreissena polymorpha]|uniref:Uncharacterized protein n=1 Tax=Dreissena polymorpha TaxID=45954 RepID=A0A9D4LUX9_DREPO|nr:hypothetical protein DPMN_028172 [Dreissena polymorpha]